MTVDALSHKGHDVNQYSVNPVSGWPYTEFYCYDCGVNVKITSRVKL